MHLVDSDLFGIADACESLRFALVFLPPLYGKVLSVVIFLQSLEQISVRYLRGADLSMQCFGDSFDIVDDGAKDVEEENLDVAELAFGVWRHPC